MNSACEIFKNTFLQNPSGSCLLNMFSIELSSFIPRVSVAGFEHVIVYWEKYKIIIFVLRILGIPCPANKCSKSAIETCQIY